VLRGRAGERFVRLGAPVLVAVWPNDLLYGITPDGLAALLGAFALGALVRLREGAGSLGEHLAAGLLFGVAFLVKYPAVVFAGLAAAYGATGASSPGPSGRTGAGGLDLGAIHKIKRFLGAARALEEGGSLTLIATAQIGSGSRLDELVTEELRSTATAEIRLDAELAERRIFPALDLLASGTRRDELLTGDEERAEVTALRRELAGLSTEEAAEKVRALVARRSN